MVTRGRPEAGPGRILWDGFGLQTLYSGVGRHAWDLHEALERRGCSPQVIASVPTLDPHFFPYKLPLHPYLPQLRIKPWALFWTSQWLRRELQRTAESLIIHGLSNYNVPALKNSRLMKVLTVHDLIPILQKQEVSAALGAYLQYQLPKALDAADSIICVSQWTEHTVLERYPHTRGRTLVIPNGWPAYTAPDQKNRSGLLTISRTESYKRLSLIATILPHLPRDIVWTVVTDSRGAELLGSLKDQRLTIRTQITDAELEAEHQKAGIYVHPSLFEGYCLPAAASISHGVPVLYAKGSGIDEVVAEAGIGLDASADGKTWAGAIQGLLVNPDREKLCRTRWERALSWDDVAARTAALYDKLGRR